MPIFYYKALTQDGEIVDGCVDAESREKALSEIRFSGRLPIDASESLANPWSLRFGTPPWGNRGATSRRDVTLLANALATLLAAGMPLDASLRMLERTTRKDALRNAVRRLCQDVQKGRSLSQAFASQGGPFDDYFVNVIRAGEASGDIAGTLQSLAGTLEAEDALRKSVIASMTYPVLLSAVAVLAILFLIIVVVPEFVPLFEDLGTGLPFATRALFWLSDVLRATWWAAGILLFVASAAFATWRKKANNRRRLSRWALRLPVVGQLVQSYVAAQFARTLATLLQGGVGLLHAMRLAVDAIENSVIREELEACIDGIRGGVSLRTLLARVRHMPPLAVELVAVGEQTGQLPSMLAKVAEVCDEEVRRKLKHLLSLLEPALILGLGGVVGAIITAILTALLGLNDLVSM
jgi:general secretion pathway protein F